MKLVFLFLILLFSLFFSTLRTSGRAVLDEFHHGYGGFSVTPDAEFMDRQQANYQLDEYIFWGESLSWQSENYKLSVSVCEVLRLRSLIASNDKAVVINKWKIAFLRELASKTFTVEHAAYAFNGSKGIELRLSGEVQIIVRVFFIGTRLFSITLTTNDKKSSQAALPVLNSFRLLTKDERVIAMIEQFSPSPLVQERPKFVPSNDLQSAGLRGPVRRIRDFSQSRTNKDRTFEQQTIFSKNGDIIQETSFREGYPDVITSWGWVDNTRVNTQSAVNYPPLEGPKSSRPIIISGYQPLSIFTNPVDRTRPSRQFGNRIEIEYDDSGRTIKRSRFSNNGQLIYVETIRYSTDRRDVKTTDASGGFISDFRELFDKQMNMVERQTVTADGSIYESEQYEYEYDSTKNWIVKRVFRKGNRHAKLPTRIFYRDISYYQPDDKNLSFSPQNRDGSEKVVADRVTIYLQTHFP